MILGGNARLPFFSAANLAALNALTNSITGDLGYTQDTKKVYTYDGAAWNDVLAGVSQDCVLISSQSVTTAPTSVTISAISAGYKAFILEVIGGASAGSNLRVWLNNDTGAARYNSNGYSYGAAGTFQQQLATTLWYPFCTGGTWGDNTNTSYTFMSISNSSTKFKAFQAHGFSGHSNLSQLASGHYNQTTEISRIDLDLGGTNTFANPTLIRLWGLK